MWNVTLQCSLMYCCSLSTLDGVDGWQMFCFLSQSIACTTMLRMRTSKIRSMRCSSSDMMWSSMILMREVALTSNFLESGAFSGSMVGECFASCPNQLHVQQCYAWGHQRYTAWGVAHQVWRGPAWSWWEGWLWLPISWRVVPLVVAWHTGTPPRSLACFAELYPICMLYIGACFHSKRCYHILYVYKLTWHPYVHGTTHKSRLSLQHSIQVPSIETKIMYIEAITTVIQ